MVQNLNIKSGEERSILQLEAIVDESYDAIIGKTIDGVIVSWNGGATRMFGYTKEEMIGRSLADLFIPEYRDEFPGLLLKIKQGETVAYYDSIWLKKDGTSADVEFSISPVHTGDRMIVGSSLVCRDVTEYNRKRKVLIESERKYKILTQSSPDCIKLFDLQGNLLFINSGGKKEHNLNNETEVKNFKAIDSVVEEDKPKFIKAFEDAKNGIGSIIEIRHTKEGSVRDVCSEMMEPIKDEKGNITSIFGVSRDLTEIKNSEEEFKKSKDELQIELEEVEKINKLMVGRELKMIELKEEIEDLKAKLEGK